MEERRNFYRILGVQPDAGADVIRSAYRTMMQKLRLHPDLGGDTAVAAAINAAYRVLRNREARARYDRELLAQWDIAELAGHRRTAGQPRRATASSGNRRNYYRVLGVQPEAPTAVIEAAYRVARQASGVNRALLDEAHAVLCNRERRRHYDRWLKSGDSAHATTTSKAAGTASCLFCKAVHCEYPASDSNQQCHRCGSPLNRVPADSGEEGRVFARLQLDRAVVVEQSWPQRRFDATVADFSPAGLRLVLALELEVDAIVRLTGAGLHAVASVIYARSVDAGYEAGVRLRTVRFTGGGVLVNTAC